jgi:hypothetical protein
MYSVGSSITGHSTGSFPLKSRGKQIIDDYNAFIRKG